MTDFKLNGQIPDGLIAACEQVDFKPSWAGAYPPGPGVAVGGEAGQVLFLGNQGEVLTRANLEVDEAINGLAFMGNWMAASTREEVRFIDRLRGEFVPVHCGAHGVSAGPDGHFLATLGIAGLLSFRPTPGEVLPVTIQRPRKANLYFYRAIGLTDQDGQHVIAVATRQDGIAAMPFGSSDRGLHTLTFEAFDAVDLCPLEKSSFAIAAVGKNGTILMCRDVIEETLKRQASVATRFGDIKGTAYRILSARGDVIVVTSQGIYFLGDMATNFLQGKTGSITILELPIKAVDANVVSDRWLMMVTTRQVLKLDLAKLNWRDQEAANPQRLVRQPSTFSPCWYGESRTIQAVSA